MLKSQTREIGERTYCVTTLGSEDGQRLFFKLAKLVGPSVAALLRQWAGSIGEDGKPKLDVDTVSAALGEFMTQLSYGDFQDFVQSFAKSTDVVDEKDTRVSLAKLMKLGEFSGDYASFVKWLGFCLEVNFASFFAGMGLTSQSPGAAKQSA
jgi:hypothetical protein